LFLHIHTAHRPLHPVVSLVATKDKRARIKEKGENRSGEGRNRQQAARRELQAAGSKGPGQSCKLQPLQRLRHLNCSSNAIAKGRLRVTMKARAGKDTESTTWAQQAALALALVLVPWTRGWENPQPLLEAGRREHGCRGRGGGCAVWAGGGQI
jgi:hypothetical protein